MTAHEIAIARKRADERAQLLQFIQSTTTPTLPHPTGGGHTTHTEERQSA